MWILVWRDDYRSYYGRRHLILQNINFDDMIDETLTTNFEKKVHQLEYMSLNYSDWCSTRHEGAHITILKLDDNKNKILKHRYETYNDYSNDVVNLKNMFK